MNAQAGCCSSCSAGPCSTSWPWCRTTRSLASASASSRSCVTSTVVRLRSSASVRSSSTIASRWCTSTERSGSSSSSTAGPGASERSRPRRCASPPDIAAGFLCACGPSPARSSSASAAVRSSCGAANVRCCSAVMCGHSAPSWNTRPRRRRSGGTNVLASAATWSPIRMLPWSWRSRPARQRSSVVLPEPDGPTIASRPPAGTANDSGPSWKPVRRRPRSVTERGRLTQCSR